MLLILLEGESIESIPFTHIQRDTHTEREGERPGKGWGREGEAAGSAGAGKGGEAGGAQRRRARTGHHLFHSTLPSRRRRRRRRKEERWPKRGSWYGVFLVGREREGEGERVVVEEGTETREVG